jgi:hypothetical protein
MISSLLKSPLSSENIGYSTIWIHLKFNQMFPYHIKSIFVNTPQNFKIDLTRHFKMLKTKQLLHFHMSLYCGCTPFPFIGYI